MRSSAQLSGGTLAKTPQVTKMLKINQKEEVM